MSFTAVILKLPFSALSTVRWEKGGEMLQERASGRSLPAPVSQRGATGGWLALGGSGHGAPLTIPRSSGSGGADLRRVKAPRGAGWGPARWAGAAATAALRTSGGEVPQLFPANCFTYVLERTWL